MIESEILIRTYLIERAPSRKGPWKHVRAVKVDLFTAIRTALDLRDGQGWLRLLPDAKIENALLVNGSEG